MLPGICNRRYQKISESRQDFVDAERVCAHVLGDVDMSAQIAVHVRPYVSQQCLGSAANPSDVRLPALPPSQNRKKVLSPIIFANHGLLAEVSRRTPHFISGQMLILL